MKHAIVYLGRLENQAALLKHGKVEGFSFFDAKGNAHPAVTSLMQVDGLIFYYMEAARKDDPEGVHTFYVVAVGDIVLASRIKLNPARHTDNKKPSPQPGQFGDLAAQTLFDDISAANPALNDRLLALRRTTWGENTGMLHLTYRNREIKGAQDLIPLTDLREGEALTHAVRVPGEPDCQAKCTVRILDNAIYLDYEGHKSFNLKQKVYIGILRLVFEDRSHRVLLSVAWKDEGTSDFVELTFDSNLGGPTHPDEPNRKFEARVAAAMGLSQSELEKKLPSSDAPPKSRIVPTRVFDRNEYVVAAVLRRAKGVCEGCGQPAPFTRHPAGTPYLEVHHRVRLADRGADSVPNAIALCPNCHRRMHYGPPVPEGSKK